MSSTVKAVDKIVNGSYTKKDIVTLLSMPKEEEGYLFSCADKIRKNVMGDEVHLRGLLEFSNYCSNDCLYCGLRRSNKSIKRYRISDDDFILAARNAKQLGYQTIVLQSGEDPYYSGAYLAEIIAKIKDISDFAVTISIGLRSLADYELMRKAGADRCLIRHETADEKLFAKLRPGTNLKDRLKHLKILRSLGYQIGSGNIVGLPEQSISSVADDILLLIELGVDMAGIGPFISHPQTPLANFSIGDINLALREIAILRLLLPGVHLPATTALATIDPAAQLQALNCGANVIMPNVTPEKYRESYSIYPNKAGSRENTINSYKRIMNLINKAGRVVSTERGDSLRKG